MGLRGVGARYSMRDFHATILQLLGLDQNRLWFLHNGRNEKAYGFRRKRDSRNAGVKEAAVSTTQIVKTLSTCPFCMGMRGCNEGDCI
jgi:hypothetical protein